MPGNIPVKQFSELFTRLVPYISFTRELRAPVNMPGFPEKQPDSLEIKYGFFS
jgi:hypothetical protein